MGCLKPVIVSFSGLLNGHPFVTKCHHLQKPARNLSSDDGFEQELNRSLETNGFDKTVTESSHPAVPVFGQASSGLHQSRLADLQPQQRPEAGFGKVSLTKEGAV